MFNTHCAFLVLQHGLIIRISYRVRRGHQDIFQQITDFRVCCAATFQLVLQLSERSSFLGCGGHWSQDNHSRRCCSKLSPWQAFLLCYRLFKGRIRRLCYSCWEGWHSPLAELTSLWHSCSVFTSPSEPSSRYGAVQLMEPAALWVLQSPTAIPRGCRLCRVAKSDTGCCCTLHSACVMGCCHVSPAPLSSPGS